LIITALLVYYKNLIKNNFSLQIWTCGTGITFGSRGWRIFYVVSKFPLTEPIQWNNMEINQPDSIAKTKSCNFIEMSFKWNLFYTRQKGGFNEDITNWKITRRAWLIELVLTIIIKSKITHCDLKGDGCHVCACVWLG